MKFIIFPTRKTIWTIFFVEIATHGGRFCLQHQGRFQHVNSQASVTLDLATRDVLGF